MWSSRPVEPAKENRLGGNDLFVRSCARCHGKDGKGTEAREDMPSIPDFSSHKWQEQRSDAQLLASILGGKGKEMPAFGDKVTREKAKELVAYLRQLDSEKAKPPEKPADSPAKQSPQVEKRLRARVRTPAAVAAGTKEVKTLYQQRCARCHGNDGKGVEARDATPEIPDFTSHPWQERRSDAELRVTIRDGKGKMMPAFGDKLRPEHDRDLVAYIRLLDPARTPTAAALDDDSFEQRFERLEKEMETLKKQLRELQSSPPQPY